MGILNVPINRISDNYISTIFGAQGLTSAPTEANNAFFTVNGKFVQCFGEIEGVDPDSEGNYLFKMTLPFTTTFTNTNQIVGISSATAGLDLQVSLIASISDGSVQITRSVGVGGSQSARRVTFQFAYLTE